MLNTLTPSCFFVRNFNPEGELLPAPVSIGVLLIGAGVLDLDIADKGRDVRDNDDSGEWNAYVMNSARDLRTSWLKFDLTKTSKAPMKWGTVSSDTTSPFMASSSRFTIPIVHVSIAVGGDLVGALTHPDQPPAIKLMVLALNGECDELLVVQLLDARRRLAPNIQINQQGSVGERVDDE